MITTAVLDSASASERRRLWELDLECHGPLVGSCWTATELRRLADRLFAGRSSLNDFALHAAVVEQCATRNKLSLALQRDLDQRAADMLRRAAAAGSVQDLAALWQGALRDGEIGAALWAAWTDPRCDEALRTRIHQDLYLLQHGRVAALRSDAAERTACLAEQQALRAEALRLQQRQARWRSEALAERDALQAQLALLRSRVLAQDAEITRLRQSASAGPQRPAGREQLVQRVAELSRQLAEARQAAERQRAGPAPLAQPTPPSPAAAGIAPIGGAKPPALRAATVLCVGGRSGHVPLYRELVERHGGCFAHHDGGLQDNPRRLDAQLAAADLVVCQSGCLNHNAYSRVKEHCKRSGKPCVYLDKPGAGSFARALSLGAAAGLQNL
jgi:hypothetical protein